MIRTLVVDDDYHVAHAHALSVSRLPGFAVVGEAHSAGDARAMVDRERPDLLLLDMYLPDQSGLDLVRQLHSDRGGSGVAPDFLLVTAAHDIDSVRAAIQLGAVYHLVKPFTFAVLRDHLEAYQRWRARLLATTDADQATVDDLYGLRPATRAAVTLPEMPLTMDRVLTIIRTSEHPLGAAEVAEQLGVSRPTAQRYLAALVQRRLLDLELAYGSTGRPEHRYVACARRL